MPAGAGVDAGLPAGTGSRRPKVATPPSWMSVAKLVAIARRTRFLLLLA
ncbi:MAG TPA: hypothetical protein VFH02_12165 [Jiangellaceae bacterium]|nr:hypothetical protein [Jiangellaceae bacterium]